LSVHEVYPYLRAAGAEDAIAFYAKAFGATEKYRLVEPSGRIGHSELLFGTATIMISDAFPEFDIHPLDPNGPSVCYIHLHVDDADQTISDAVEAGAKIVRPAEDQFYGERSGTVRDPFGYDWLIGHWIEKVEPDEMQRRYTEMLQTSETG
jgi:uncharacterized glyoxalase superfamily protein PhnB